MLTRDEQRKHWFAVISDELAKVGVDWRDKSALRDSADVVHRALPVLLSLLHSVESNEAKEWIANALRAAKPHLRSSHRGNAAQHLIEEFRRAAGWSSESLKWQIGSALADLSDESVSNAIAELWIDRRHGSARQMLAEALVKSRHADAVNLLAQCLDDPAVQPHAIIALGKMKAVEQRDRIAAFLNSDSKLVRQEAERALARIDGTVRRWSSKVALPKHLGVADHIQEPALRASEVLQYARGRGLAEYQHEIEPDACIERIGAILQAAGVRDADGSARAIADAIGKAEIKDTGTYIWEPGVDSIAAPFILHWYLGDPDVVELSAYGGEEFIHRMATSQD